MVGSCIGNECSTHSGDNFNAERWDNCVAEVKDGTFNKHIHWLSDNTGIIPCNIFEIYGEVILGVCFIKSIWVDCIN